nr:hypothetical protein [Tanacetum cinerariifolium]
MEAKEKGVVLDAEAEAFLADVECTASYVEPLSITTTTAFEASHEDAYDSDVNEGPHAATAFMANLNDVSSVLPGGISVITILDDLNSQLAGHIKVNEEQSFANDTLKAKLERYKTQESYLVELVCLRNTNKVVMELLQSYGQPVQTIPMLSTRPIFPTKDLHKTALGHSNPLYLKTAQLCRPSLYLGDVIVDPVHTSIRVYDSEETLVQAEVSRTKMLEKMKDPLCKMSSKPVNYAKLNSLHDTFVPQKQLSRERVYWLPANEVASYNSYQYKLVTDFVRTRPTKSQVNTHNVSNGIAIPEKPKVLAPGLYAMTPKYVPPQKRNNRKVNIPLPRKEKVSSVKQPNVSVNLSTGIKSVTKASKSKH